MRTLIEWFGSLFGGNVKVIKVEGKERPEMIKRTKKLRDARESKESKNRTGNKKSTNHFED